MKKNHFVKKFFSAIRKDLDYALEFYGNAMMKI